MKYSDQVKSGFVPEVPPQGDNSDPDKVTTSDGRYGRYMTLSVQLVQKNLDSIAPYYSSMRGRIIYNHSIGIVFFFEDEDGVKRKVTIKGRNLEVIHDTLAAGRREVIRVNGDTVQSIEIE